MHAPFAYSTTPYCISKLCRECLTSKLCGNAPSGAHVCTEPPVLQQAQLQKIWICVHFPLYFIIIWSCASSRVHELDEKVNSIGAAVCWNPLTCLSCDTSLVFIGPVAISADPPRVGTGCAGQAVVAEIIGPRLYSLVVQKRWGLTSLVGRPTLVPWRDSVIPCILHLEAVCRSTTPIDSCPWAISRQARARSAHDEKIPSEKDHNE